MNTFIFTLIQLVNILMVLYATQDLSRIVNLGLNQREYWTQEYWVRLCASIEALELNLNDGATALENRGPSQEEVIAIRQAATFLIEKTHQEYPFAKEKCPNFRGHFYTVLQVHPDQPAVWPNWVARYIR
jgi:hypothetical protein